MCSEVIFGKMYHYFLWKFESEMKKLLRNSIKLIVTGRKCCESCEILLATISSRNFFFLSTSFPGLLGKKLWERGCLRAAVSSFKVPGAIYFRFKSVPKSKQSGSKWSSHTRTSTGSLSALLKRFIEVVFSGSLFGNVKKDLSLFSYYYSYN